MNLKKPANRKSRNSGISLEPDLIKRSKDFAEKNGFGSLSNWVRFLLTQELSRAAGNPSYKIEEVSKPNAKNNGSEKGKVQSGAGVVISPASDNPTPVMRWPDLLGGGGGKRLIIMTLDLASRAL
jgi:hypothetical protein